jgi:malonyl-CoA O-methyltransferase
MHIKKLIETSFSRSCEKYEREAILQKKAGKYLIHFAGDNIKGKILDLGSGTGFIGEFLDKELKENLIGLDISKKMLQLAKCKGYFVIKGDMEKLPLKNKSVDTVLSNFSLHWTNIDIAFKEIKRVLKDDGSIVLNIPVEGSLAVIKDILGKSFFNFLSPDEVIKLVENYFYLEKIEFIKFSLEFNNGYDLLLHLHNTGVTINPNETSLKRKREILKKFKEYKRNVELNYNLLFIMGRKKPARERKRLANQ